MSPLEMIGDMKEQNGRLRGLTGSGQPGLYTLLGGSGVEQDAAGLKFTGGSGQVSATSRVAEAYKDTRLAAVASGTPVPGTGGGTSGRNPGDRNTPVIRP